MASAGRIETDSPRPKTEDTTQTSNRLEENLKDYLKDKLKPVAHKWRLFGVQLHIPPDRLDTLKAMKKPCRECFQEMIHFWLEDDTKHYWKKIFDALNKIEKGNLRKKLEEKYSPDNLVELSETELINTLNGIQDRWKRFGCHLGVSSDELNMIAQDKSDDDCLNDVIDLWFNNYKPTLETLCQALRNVQKAKLASEIYQILSKRCQPSLTCLSSNCHVETDAGISEVPLSVEEQTLCEENELTGRLSQLTLESQQTSDQPSYSRPEQESNDSVHTHTSQVYNEPQPESS